MRSMSQCKPSGFLRFFKRFQFGESAQGMTEYVLLVVLVMIPMIEVTKALYEMVFREYRIISLFVNLAYP